MNIIRLTRVFTWLGSVWLTSIMAAQTTAPPPITIEADEATLQEQDGASIYRGHVTLIQGGLRFDADEVRVESKDGKLSRMIASGSPVKYQQKKSGQKSIAAEAKTVEYLASSSRAIFRGNAKLTQGNNSFSGDKIEYDALTDTVKAGAREKERVKIVIQPNGVISPQVGKSATDATANAKSPSQPESDNLEPAKANSPESGKPEPGKLNSPEPAKADTPKPLKPNAEPLSLSSDAVPGAPKQTGSEALTSVKPAAAPTQQLVSEQTSSQPAVQEAAQP